MTVKKSILIIFTVSVFTFTKAQNYVGRSVGGNICDSLSIDFSWSFPQLFNQALFNGESVITSNSIIITG